MLSLLTFTNSFSLRGLYLQPNEIETLFSAPVSRPDLIRYRLRSAIARSLFGSLFFGWMFARRAPVPAFAFSGAVVAMLTLPMVGQAFSLVLGDAENRFAGKLAKLPWRVLTMVSVFLAIGGYFATMRGGVLERAEGRGFSYLASVWAEHPLARALRLPFTPWVRSISAVDLVHFVPWFAACVAIAIGLWLAVPRIPVDFRELSLETSADVARRLSRARRGLGATQGSASAATRSWRTPWLAGRGPFGAVAWRKAVSILRKSRTSFVVGGLIVALVSVLSVTVFATDGRDAFASAVFVAGFGTFYLCIGLRFDFREDLELVGLVRSWPIAPWKVFLATLLPETLLVSVMITLGVAGVAIYRQDPDPRLALLVAVVPLAVLVWTSIDNATFLFAPVRTNAAQDGALQNAGRAMMLMVMRMIGLAIAIGLAVIPYAIAAFALELPSVAAVAVGILGGLPIVLVEVGLLVLAGGAVLRRFDVARDTP
ncbi:MAG: hypothetical protein NTV21_17855 [Planctomycetota bacterium]|nr:hypothetical protein [Planctomycetota bacterium]